MQLNSDLPLEDHCKVAIEFYQTALASRFGMLAERFGVHWMVLTDTPAKNPAAKSDIPATKAKN